MIQLGFNSVLFGGHPLEEAIRYAAVCGYDGLELSAIDGMSEHLVLDRWREIAPEIKRLSAEFGVPLLAMEQPSRDPQRMETAFEAAAALGIPIVNCGPGGKSGNEDDVRQLIDSLGTLSERAAHYGVTLCVKAHVGAAMHDTQTTLRVLQAVTSPAFGLDMDPSHIYRGGENPVEALGAVIDRIRHVHIRDCKGRQQGPGKPELQANGRGDIDLLGFVRVLVEHGYDGPLDLEVIGAKDCALPACVAIAAEAKGHMQACLQASGGR